MTPIQIAFAAAAVVCAICVVIVLALIHLAEAIDNERPQE